MIERGRVLQHVGDTFALLALAVYVLLMLFGLSFALEESYPSWPMQPGWRVMPAGAVYASYGVIAFLLASVFWPRARRWAFLLGAINIAALISLFLLITNDILISRGPSYA